MNTDDLRTMLAERAETVDGTRPSRLDEIHRRIEATRRHRWLMPAPDERPEGRVPVMSTTVRIAVASAVVIAAAVIGVSYLTGRDDIASPATGEGPTSLPSSTATIPETGNREPGRYSVSIFGSATLSADVSVESQDWAFDRWLLRRDGTAYIVFWTASWVNSDPCSAAPDPINLPPGHSTDEFVAALDRQAGTDLSAPTDVIVGGYSGVRVNLTSTSCTRGTLWSDADSFTRPNVPGTISLWIVDVAGTTVLIDADTAQVDAEIEAMIDSVTFTRS